MGLGQSLATAPLSGGEAAQAISLALSGPLGNMYFRGGSASITLIPSAAVLSSPGSQRSPVQNPL